MMSRILKDENDIVILDTTSSTKVDLSIFALIIGVGSFGVFLEENISNNPDMFPEVLKLLFGGLIFWVGLKTLLADNRIIIDKKSQSVIIKSKPIKEILFSDINYVGITFFTTGGSNTDEYFDEGWVLSLSTTQGWTEIYETRKISDAKKIAEKIGRLTDKKIERLSRA